ncbi:MAG TPA: cytoplasmic protein [Desulfosporosinus sp.]|nr:cytoplasmic protein [Desulfosporosinus sp.]
MTKDKQLTNVPEKDLELCEKSMKPSLDLEKIVKAHKYSSNHRNELLKDKKCGCFYCLTIFNPNEIWKWIADISGTAICPYCEIDSIIGESSGYPITLEFLKKMEEYWF